MHFSPDPSSSNSTRVLQTGQTRMSSAYFGTAMIISAEEARAFECVNRHSIKRRQASATRSHRSNRKTDARHLAFVRNNSSMHVTPANAPNRIALTQARARRSVLLSPAENRSHHDQSLRTQSNDSMLGGPAAPLPFERTLAKRGPARKNSPRLARHGLACRGIRAIFFFAADFIVITAILHRT